MSNLTRFILEGTKKSWVIATSTPTGEKYLIARAYQGKVGPQHLSDTPSKKLMWATKKGAQDVIDWYVAQQSTQVFYVKQLNVDLTPKRLPLKTKLYNEFLARDLERLFGVGRTFELVQLFNNYIGLSDAVYGSDSTHNHSPWMRGNQMTSENYINNAIGLGIISISGKRGNSRVFTVEKNTTGLYNSHEELLKDLQTWILRQQKVAVDALVHNPHYNLTDVVANFSARVLKEVTTSTSWKTMDQEIHLFTFKYATEKWEKWYKAHNSYPLELSKRNIKDI